MEKVTAKLNDYRQSPRKVRVVADVIRGQKVKQALINLQFLTKSASHPLLKLLKSAIANAKNKDIEADDLVIKEIKVDGGKILYRRSFASRGRSPRIRKRTSHISIILSELPNKESRMKNKGKTKRAKNLKLHPPKISKENLGGQET